MPIQSLALSHSDEELPCQVETIHRLNVESDCSLGFGTLRLLRWNLAATALWVKALAAQPDSLSLSFRTYVVEGEN